MGDDYNHSTFVDLILSGLLGLRPRADGLIVVNPLVSPDSVDHFAVDHILYHGRMLSIVWDKDGTHYNQGQGLRLLVDGATVARANTITKLTVQM